MIISLDCETTGLDLRHGALPFLVTTCNDNGESIFWEWEVDPYTRQPEVPRTDLIEVQEIISDAACIVLQNAKFDVAALASLFKRAGMTFKWRWEKVRDTLLAGHLLASNQPHDLTTMAMVYLGVNIQPLEDAIKAACVAARRMVQAKNSKYADFRIAKEDLEEMPSAKKETWKFDMWLPKLFAKLLGYAKNHPWYTACEEYANGDSTVTLPLYKKQQEILEMRGLWRLYEERLKILPVVYDIEDYGVTVNKDRLETLVKDYTEEANTSAAICCNIASSYGYELELPKGGNNNSLTTFVFDVMKLPVYKKSKKTGAPSLDKNVIEHYEATLPHTSKELAFVRNLRGKRKRDTAVGYLESYKRFWIPTGIYNDKGEQLWYRLHPSLNPTGTDTLRWSSQYPNEQNISKQEGFNLRYCFGPAPGREWYSCDAKNIELRLPAYESGEQELISLFERPDDPPYYGSTHLLNFHTVYPDIWDKVLKEVGFEKVGPTCKKRFASTWYQWCKNGGFAVQYGAIERTDVEGTADRAFHRVGSHALLKARFSMLEKLNQACIAHAEKYGYVETMPDKTVDPKRGYPLLCTRTNYGKILPTVPLNYHVQGTACWWMMKAMTRCHTFLQEYNRDRKPEYQVHIVMQIHDELVFDFPKAPVAPTEVKDWRTDKFKYARSNLPTMRKIRAIMQQGGDDLGVPTPVSVEHHPVCWSEGVTL